MARAEVLPSVRAKIGQVVEWVNGVRVEVFRKLPLRRSKPSFTAIHEAHHVVASDTFEEASVAPQGDSLGHTKAPLTPANVGAAIELDPEGSSWDAFLAVAVLGISPQAAAAAANARLAGKEEEIYEIARLLDERIVIGPSDAKEGYENVRRRRAGIHEVKVLIHRPDGQTQEIDMESLDNHVVIPGEVVELPKAA